MRLVVLTLVGFFMFQSAAGEAVAQEVLPQPVVVESTTDVQLGPPEELGPVPENPYRHSGSVDFGIFVDSLDLSSLDLTFADTEVEALDGLSLDSSIFRSLVTGGVSLNFGGRLWQVLRFPELRITLGGGSFDRGRFPIRGSEFSIRPDTLFFCRIELAAGLQYRLGRVTPFAMVRGSVAGYIFDVHVDHRQLGGLGSETVSDSSWELATDVGLSIELIRQLELGLAWRHTWIGPPSDGGMVTLTVNTN